METKGDCTKLGDHQRPLVTIGDHYRHLETYRDVGDYKLPMETKFKETV